MTWPDWRPMPDTSGLTIAKAAIVRASHRRLMMLRWRNPELRAEDKKFKRLPIDWHDWMMCPADDGYQHMGCTCDSWLDAQKRSSPHPRAVAAHERAERARLEKDIYIHRQKGLEAAAAARPPRGAIWVKTIDPHLLQQTLAPHAVQASAKVVDEAHQAIIREAAMGPQGVRQRRGVGGQRQGRVAHMGLREPPWVLAAGYHLSRMRATGSGEE